MSHDQIESLKKHFQAEMAKMEEQRKKDMDMIMSMLKPIADTYETANRAAKWVKNALIFLGIVASLIISYKKITE